MACVKTVLLGITGSIAAYKSTQLLRTIQSSGASLGCAVDVQVVMTRTAHRFVAPLPLQILSRRPVYTDMFDASASADIAHLRLSQGVDLILIAPATANFIAKMAMGMADDLLSTLILSASAQIVLAPAMDLGMWDHPTVRKNIFTLRERGVQVIEPEVGPLASGHNGEGRLADESVIANGVMALLLPERGRLVGEEVLVTAGPTHEAIDPVRFISNRSSGKMGYALAAVARQWGANVTLISGPVLLEAPQGVNRINVESAEEMYQRVLSHARNATIVLMAAAVCDYRPKERSPKKIKKVSPLSSLDLIETDDILMALSHEEGGRIVVGFAAETDCVVENAKEKMKRKGLDLIVANDVTQDGAGFDLDTNIVYIIDAAGEVTALPKMSKQAVAEHILERVCGLRGNMSLHTDRT